MRLDNISKAAKAVDEHINEKAELLPFSQENLSFQIETKNFHELPLFSSPSVLAAVDGGNAEILSTPGISVHVIRVAGVVFKGKEKIKTNTKEGIFVISAETKSGRISYKCKSYSEHSFNFPSLFPQSIDTLDGHRLSLDSGSIANMLRKNMEISLAIDLCSEFPGSSIVLDGSIEAKTKDELELISGLMAEATRHMNKIGFLSKTCTMLTSNGHSLSSALLELGPKASWFYYPAFKPGRNQGKVLFVRLHSKSEYVFHLGLGNDVDAAEFVLQLSLQSSDPVFFGYPYCLIYADKIARISNEEKEYYKSILLSRVSGKKKLRYLMSSIDAHSILDRISF